MVIIGMNLKRGFFHQSSPPTSIPREKNVPTEKRSGRKRISAVPPAFASRTRTRTPDNGGTPPDLLQRRFRPTECGVARSAPALRDDFPAASEALSPSAPSLRRTSCGYCFPSSQSLMGPDNFPNVLSGTASGRMRDYITDSPASQSFFLAAPYLLFALRVVSWKSRCNPYRKEGFS